MADTMSHPLSLLAAAAIALGLLVGCVAPEANADTSAGHGSAGPRLIKVQTPARTGGAVRLKVRVLRNLSRLSVRVNGRRLKKPLDVNVRRRLMIHLDALDRVRFGRNRIVVRAERGRRHQVSRLTVRVRRDTPLVGVRIPRHTRQHQPVRLDARATRARGQGRLRYRWRIVAAPRRAHARLTGGRHARSYLLASHPGRYLLALTVRNRRSPVATSAANRGCAVTGAARTPPRSPMTPVSLPDGRPIASTPLERLPDPGSNLERFEATKKATRPPGDRLAARPKSATGCTTQYVGVEVEPAAGPLGVAFESQISVNGLPGMRVGATFYPSVPGSSSAVYLDADTLETLGSVVVPPGQNAEDWATLEAIRYTFDHEVLILLTGPGFTLVKGATEGDDTAISNESLVEGDGTGQPGAPGQLSGWLQPSIPVGSTDDSFRLVSPDRISISTGQGTGVSNKMTVGDQQYGATLPAGTEAGFHVLVTDPALRPILGTPAFFSTDTGNPGIDAVQQGALANLLRQANGTTASTVVIQSIGHPRPTTEASLSIGQQIEKLGGSEWMYLSMDGTTGYALIGNPPALGAARNSVPSAETSSKWTATGGDSLQGLLKRRHDGALQATLADAVGGMDFSLQQIAFQPPVPWPESDTSGKRAAGIWIAQQLDIGTQDPGLCAPTRYPDVRAEYCNLSVSTSDLRDQVRALQYPEGQDGFAQDDFTAVQNQLVTELGMVSTVRRVIGAMQVPFALSGSTTEVDADQVAANLIDSIPAPADSPVSADLGLSSAVLYAAAEVPVVGEAFGPIAAGLDIASDLTEQSGVPSPDSDIETTKAAAGSAVDARLQATYGALGAYGEILVDDFGKLSAADEAAKNRWGQTASVISGRMSLLRLGVKQWLYTAITPAAYDLVEIPGADPATASKQVHCVYSSAPFSWRPWLKADPTTMFFPLNDWANGAPVPGQMMAMLHGPAGDKRSNAVSAGSPLADDLFGDANDGDASLVPPWFYDRADWTVKRPKMVQPSTALKPGVCKVGSI